MVKFLLIVFGSRLYQPKILPKTSFFSLQNPNSDRLLERDTDNQYHAVH